jgi:hypothetical protein
VLILGVKALFGVFQELFLQIPGTCSALPPLALGIVMDTYVATWRAFDLTRGRGKCWPRCFLLASDVPTRPIGIGAGWRRKTEPC